MPIVTNNIVDMTFRYVYAAGALITLVARLLEPAMPASTPLRIKRLKRLESWSSLMFCVAAFFAFYPTPPVIRDWLAFTLAGAAIQIYSFIALTLAMRPKRK